MATPGRGYRNNPEMGSGAWSTDLAAIAIMEFTGHCLLHDNHRGDPKILQPNRQGIIRISPQPLVTFFLNG